MDTAWSMEVDGIVARLQFDDGKRNALTAANLSELNAFLDEAEKKAKAVLLMGRPGCFSAGFNLKTMGEGGDPQKELLRAGALTLARLLVYPLPVVAGCTGHALAAGALVLLASDVRVGAEGDFSIGLNEVAIGMGLPRFLIELARYRIPQPAFESILWGTVHRPAAAQAHGYLDEVVGAEGLELRCMTEATRLGELSQLAVAWSKPAVRGEVASRMRDGVELDLRDLG